MDDDALPDGWTVWHARPDGLIVLTFRPDVFDGSAFPSACLPTLTVKPQRTRGGRGRPQPPSDDVRWSVVLTLEPDVVVEERTTQGREAAIRTGRTLVADFVEGELDIRDAHPDPAGPFLQRIDELRDP